MIIVHSWESMQRTFEARASEWALGASVLTLGVLCLTMNISESSLLVTLLKIRGLWFWGVMFLAIGSARLAVLIVNGSYWRTPHLRCIGAFLSCYVWFQMILSLDQRTVVGLAILPWVFLLDAYNVMRAGHEAGISQLLQNKRRASPRRRENGTSES